MWFVTINVAVLVQVKRNFLFYSFIKENGVDDKITKSVQLIS